MNETRQLFKALKDENNEPMLEEMRERLYCRMWDVRPSFCAPFSLSSAWEFLPRVPDEDLDNSMIQTELHRESLDNRGCLTLHSV